MKKSKYWSKWVRRRRDAVVKTLDLALPRAYAFIMDAISRMNDNASCLVNNMSGNEGGASLTSSCDGLDE